MTKRAWTLSAAVGLFSFGAMLAPLSPAFAEEEGKSEKAGKTGEAVEDAGEKLQK